MKRVKIPLLLILSLLVIAITLPVNSVGNTILGESIFPAEEEDVFIWETINATEAWYDEVDYVKFTVDNIYNLTFNSENFLFLNYSLEFYHRFSWVPQHINTFYMAYNKTLNFLNWSEGALETGEFFIFPIPLNLTLIKDSIEVGSNFTISNDGQKLILDYGNNTVIENTINSNGISKVIEKITNGSTVFKWELNVEDIIIRIPFGYSVLFFTGIGITTLIYLDFRRLRKKS